MSSLDDDVSFGAPWKALGQADMYLQPLVMWLTTLSRLNLMQLMEVFTARRLCSILDVSLESPGLEWANSPVPEYRVRFVHNNLPKSLEGCDGRILHFGQWETTQFDEPSYTPLPSKAYLRTHLAIAKVLHAGSFLRRRMGWRGLLNVAGCSTLVMRNLMKEAAGVLLLFPVD